MPLQRVLLYVTVVASTCLGPSLALAGPPLITEDPETPGQRGWEVNISHNIEKVNDEFLMAVPLLDFNYGFLENDQLKIEFPVLSSDPTDDRNRWGVGDMEIGYKYRFFDEDQRGYQLGVYPQLLIPTGNDQLGLGGGLTELNLPLLLAKHFCEEKLFVYAEVGYTIAFEDAAFNFWRWGMAASWKTTEKLQLMGEVGGFVFSGQPNVGPDLLAENGGEADDVFFNLGVKYEFNDNVAFIGSAGRSFRDRIHGTPELLTFVGVQITWGGEKKNENGETANGNKNGD